MSVWANAAGKPQLTYAERLRRATQASSSSPTNPSSLSTSTTSSSLGASSSGAVSSSSSSSSATAHGAPSSQPSSSPRQTLVISSPLASSSATSASNATISPLNGAKIGSGTVADRSSGSATVSGTASSGEQKASASSRPATGRGSLSGASLTGASSSPLSSQAVTASASVNGDDAASTTHSVNTESSSSAAPSTSTAPTSVNSPSAPASSVLSKSSSVANLSAYSIAGANGSSSTTPAASAAAPSSSTASAPINVWEVRKQAMLEKQKQQEEVQRKARLQGKQAKDAAKAEAGTASAPTTTESNPSSAAAAKNAADRKNGGGNVKAPSPSTTISSNAGRPSGSASSVAAATATQTHPTKSSASGAQQGRTATSHSNASATRGAGAAGSTTSTKASRHQPSSSTVSAASPSALSATATATASKADRSAAQQGATTAGPTTFGDGAVQEGRRGSEAEVGKRGRGKAVAGGGDDNDGGVEKRREEEEGTARVGTGRAGRESVGSSAHAGRRTTTEGSVIEDLHPSSRSSNIDSTIATTPTSHSSEVGLLDSPSIRDTSSSTLNGAAMPFYSPSMVAHMGHHPHHAAMAYAHPHQHQHTHHHGYAPDLGPVPLAPLPPPVTMSTASAPGATNTPASSRSVSLLRSPPQPSTDYDNTWLERIHMLNGGQNMPVYGPLTLASTRKYAGDGDDGDGDRDVEEGSVARGDAASSSRVGSGNASSIAGSAIEDLAAVPFEKGAAAAELASLSAHAQHASREATYAGAQDQAQAHLLMLQQQQQHAQAQAQSAGMMYPDTRSRARRRSSTGHKGRKAGALAALASAPPGSKEKSRHDGSSMGNGSAAPSAAGDGTDGEATGAAAAEEGTSHPGGVIIPPSLDDTQSWPIPLDARSAREHDRAVQVQARDRVMSAAAAQAAAMAAAVGASAAAASSSLGKMAAPAMNGRSVSMMSNASGSTSGGGGGGKMDGRGKNSGAAGGGKKGKGQGAVVSSQHQGQGQDRGAVQIAVPGGSESRSVGGAEGPNERTPSEAKGKGIDGAGVQTPASRKGPLSKPLDIQVARAMGGGEGSGSGSGSGSSLSPRPAHLPATPTASLVIPPLASPGINGPARGQSPFNSNSAAQTRAGYARMANGTAPSGHASYDHLSNGGGPGPGPGLAVNVGMSYHPALAASMWNGTPSSPLPYHRPHRINKDGSFSPTRAVDYASNGGYYGGGMADGTYAGSSGSGYARGMGGKRGRGGRGGWRGGGSGGSGPRNREYSLSASAAQHAATVDSAHGQSLAGYDPRYAGSMTPTVPQVYYVPYPVPVPYATSASRAESNEASSVADGGAAVGARTVSEPASDAGGATSSRAASDGTSTPAAGYMAWQQPGSAAPYSYYNGIPVVNTSWMMNVAPPDAVRAQALSQLDFYFSPRNLEGDFFLRQRMDSHGWVSIPIVAAFKKVRQITTDVNVIRDAMLYSYNLEVDMENWRVRKRYGWEEYVLPVEQQVAALPQSQQEEGGHAASANGGMGHEGKGHASVHEGESRQTGMSFEGGQSTVDATTTTST
ncbi:unnamed protein product [Tilletia controversa]|nr:unnamed protein product [Tilletia controversa]CAD6913833.1 unnamed protein product [Tilletia controversa]CAD6944471.1 unnamed protein product [Tilletia controversa]CAD6976995.1 unnamed protein product [Tilletia controversa]